jgi:flagellar basal body-associated protein FliL
MAEIIAQNPKKATTLLRILIIVVVIIVLVGIAYYLWKNYGGEWGLTKPTQPQISSFGIEMPANKVSVTITYI